MNGLKTDVLELDYAGEMALMSTVLYVYAKMASLYGLNWNVGRAEIDSFLRRHGPKEPVTRACPGKGPPESST